jgi:hypothetical protein
VKDDRKSRPIDSVRLVKAWVMESSDPEFVGSCAVAAGAINRNIRSKVVTEAFLRFKLSIYFLGLQQVQRESTFGNLNSHIFKVSDCKRKDFRQSG